MHASMMMQCNRCSALQQQQRPSSNWQARRVALSARRGARTDRTPHAGEHVACWAARAQLDRSSAGAVTSCLTKRAPGPRRGAAGASRSGARATGNCGSR